MEEGINMSKNQFLVNDFVAMEDVCNANCSYCITASSNFKSKHDLKFCEDKLEFHLEKLLDDENSYNEGCQLKERIDQVTDLLFQGTNPHILKISGGEIFLIKDIQKYFEKMAPLYKRIQVLTNGTLLSRDILQGLHKIPNLSLQISMDGHTLELNNYRIKNEGAQKKICKVLELCAEYDIKTEINCVLTNRNIEGIYDFALYLQPYTNILLQPYPVRGKYKERFFPLKHQLDGFKKLLEDYDMFSHMLPPKVYLEELEMFLMSGKRRMGCYIPWAIYQSFDDGIISPCPNIWIKSFGNVLTDTEKTLAKIGNDPFYKLTARSQPVLEQCKCCFTPWDILNLFVKGTINIKDMSKIYLYNHPDTLKYLQEFAADISK